MYYLRTHADGPDKANAGGADDLITTTNTAGKKLGKKAYITLTKNDKDQIIGINFEDINTGSEAKATWQGGADFKAGLKVVNGYQIGGSTPIYIYKMADPNKDTVTVSDFSDFTGVVTDTTAHNAQVFVYSYNDKDVSAVVIEDTAIAGDTTGQTIQEVVVKGSKRDTSANTTADTKLAELTVIYQGEEATYTKFASTVAGAASPANGGIYTMTINKDGETIDALTPVAWSTTTITVTSVDSQEFTLGGNTGLKLASAVEPTIVKFEGGAYVPGTFADLKYADTTTSSPKDINWSYLDGNTNYVDTIVVLGTTTTSALGTAIAAYKDAADALAANTNPADSTTLKTAADNAKLAAGTAITDWEAATSKTFATDTDATITALRGYKTTSDAKVTAYETAASKTAPTVVFTDVAGQKYVEPTITNTDAFVMAFSGTGTGATIDDATGKVTFTGNGNFTASATASLNGYAVNVVITKPTVTMTDFDSTKTITASTGS